ncbi:hypothetical protein, partial [Brevibacillus sp. SIMBA_076]
MKLGLYQSFDPRLVPLIDSTRAFYEKRGTGRGPNSWNELQAIRDAARSPAPSSPPPVLEVARHDGRSVPVRIHYPTSAT